MQMVVEVIRVDLVAQKETLNLTEMLSFKKQEKEKELAKKVAPSSQSIGSVKGSAQNYVDYCLFFTQNVELINTYIFLLIMKRH